VKEEKKLFPNETVLITKYFDIHQDWEVPIPGFFIIASVRNIKSIADFTEDELREFSQILCQMRIGMREILNIQEVYLFQREDTEHTFHLCLFPRYDWMEKFGKKSESMRPIINYAKENMCNEDIFREVKKTVAKIRNYMEKLIKI